MTYRLGPNPTNPGMSGSPGSGRVMMSIPLQDQNYPNPFNPTTTIKYHLPRPAEVGLTIFDVRGNRIRHFAPGLEEAGTHQIVWDGHNDDGHAVSSGTYLSVLEAGDSMVTRKIVLLK